MRDQKKTTDEQPKQSRKSTWDSVRSAAKKSRRLAKARRYTRGHRTACPKCLGDARRNADGRIAWHRVGRKTWCKASATVA